MYIIICCEFGNGNYTLSNVVIFPLLHAYIIVQMISETKREDLCSVCIMYSNMINVQHHYYRSTTASSAQGEHPQAGTRE